MITVETKIKLTEKEFLKIVKDIYCNRDHLSLLSMDGFYEFKDSFVVDCLKQHIDHLKQFKTITFIPKEEIDISFFEELKDLEELIVPIDKIKNKKFILNMPSLKKVFYEAYFSGINSASVLKTKIKYINNLKKFTISYE